MLDPFYPTTHKEVRYVDKSYRDKKIVMMKLFNENADAYRTIKIIGDKIFKNIGFDVNIIEEFLICGYLAYCKNEKNGFDKIDVDNLKPTYRSNVKMWEYYDYRMTQNRLIPDNDIVYISYNDNILDSSFSLLDQIYRGIVKIDDKEYMDYVVDKYSEMLSFKFDMISLKGRRKQKVKRIVDE